jgi:hypothetical protein
VYLGYIEIQLNPDVMIRGMVLLAVFYSLAAYVLYKLFTPSRAERVDDAEVTADDEVLLEEDIENIERILREEAALLPPEVVLYYEKLLEQRYKEVG